jgi:hypothetical protein
MATAINSAIDEVQLMKVIEHWAEAIRTKNLDARMSNYAPNVSLFDVVESLQSLGSDAVRKRAGEWLSSFERPSLIASTTSPEPGRMERNWTCGGAPRYAFAKWTANASTRSTGT